MKTRLQNDLKAAMKAGDKPRLMTIRGVLSEITRLEKDVRREANDAEIVQIVKRERARRDEALEFARKGN
ncbi:MAG: GatB/YqeY domain-containing protein, partial [Candidatus Binataceae bacterium]